MSEEYKLETADPLTEQLQAGHRSRVNGSVLQGFQNNNVQFHEVMPDASYLETVQQTEEPHVSVAEENTRSTETNPSAAMPESYLNYAAQLLEQMRGVYSTSWDSCANGTTWHGGHNHFYSPCSGADVTPPSHNCPTCPQPTPYPASYDCGCQSGTATYYDDCAYKLQKISDQLNRIETMTNEMYSTNQQLFSYLIEYYNVMTNSGKSK